MKKRFVRSGGALCSGRGHVPVGNPLIMAFGRLLLESCAFCVALAVAPLPALGDPPPLDEEPAPGAVRPSGEPAMRVYIDPKTGRFGPPVTGTANRRKAPGAVVPPPPPPTPVEMPGETPAGGVMIDGRGFKSEMRSAVTPDGKVTTGCGRAESPGEEGRK